MFVGMSELVHGVYVHTTFVSEGASSDEGLAISGYEVCGFVDEAGEFGEVIEGASAEDFVSLFFELQV